MVSLRCDCQRSNGFSHPTAHAQAHSLSPAFGGQRITNTDSDEPMTQVFEAKATVVRWNDDYYHPIALKFYDSAIADMLRRMAVPKGSKVLDAGRGAGVRSIRV